MCYFESIVPRVRVHGQLGVKFPQTNCLRETKAIRGATPKAVSECSSVLILALATLALPSCDSLRAVFRKGGGGEQHCCRRWRTAARTSGNRVTARMGLTCAQPP